MRILPLILALTMACGDRQSNIVTSKSNGFIVEESVLDSLNLGLRGRFKIAIEQIRQDSGDVIVEFKLFEKEVDGWKTKQSYKAGKDGVTSLDVEFSDFNNDGLNDMIFRSAVAARGANNIRTLFLFDNARGELLLIKNSSEYPNLRFNEMLNCIDAWLVYGGSSTVFLKIEGDSLREFADVRLLDGHLTVATIDDNGQKKVLKDEEVDQDVYTRYKNYNPLVINRDERDY